MPQLGQGRNMWRPGAPGGMGSSRPIDLAGGTLRDDYRAMPIPGDGSLGSIRSSDYGVGGNQIQELGGQSRGDIIAQLAAAYGGGQGGLAGLAGGSRLGGGRFGMPGDTFDAGGRSPELLRQQYAALSPDEQNKYKAMYMGASPGMQASVLGAMGLGPGSRGLEGGSLGTVGGGPGSRGLEGGSGSFAGAQQQTGPGRDEVLRRFDSSAVGPAQAAALGRGAPMGSGQEAWRGLKQAYGGGGSAGWQDFKQGQQQAGTFDALKSRTLGGGPAAGTAAAGGFGGGGGGRAPAAGPTAAGGFGPPAAPRGGFGVGAPGSQPFGGSLGGLQGLAGGFGGRKRPGQATEEYAG